MSQLKDKYLSRGTFTIDQLRQKQTGYLEAMLIEAPRLEKTIQKLHELSNDKNLSKRQEQSLMDIIENIMKVEYLLPFVSPFLKYILVTRLLHFSQINLEAFEEEFSYYRDIHLTDQRGDNAIWHAIKSMVGYGAIIVDENGNPINETL